MTEAEGSMRSKVEGFAAISACGFKACPYSGSCPKEVERARRVPSTCLTSPLCISDC